MTNKRKNNILKKIIFTILIIILLRIGNIIPVPNVDQTYLVNLVNSNTTLKPFFNNKTRVRQKNNSLHEAGGTSVFFI